MGRPLRSTRILFFENHKAKDDRSLSQGQIVSVTEIYFIVKYCKINYFGFAY